MKRVYLFEEGSADMRDLLGGKGANLAEMTNIGLPVPPGFTITTDVCRGYETPATARRLNARSARQCARMRIPPPPPHGRGGQGG
jgi:phosphoenolpyruvate synthase/pyruvate phosphate dikinase